MVDAVVVQVDEGQPDGEQDAVGRPEGSGEETGDERAGEDRRADAPAEIEPEAQVIAIHARLPPESDQNRGL